MNNIRRERKNEQGSVLIVCLGMLVVLAIMATAFISAVTLQKGASVNYRHKGMAEAAVMAGRAEAMFWLYKTADLSDAVTSSDEDWVNQFTGSDVDDMWSFAGVSGTSSIANYIGPCGASVWVPVCRYDIKGKKKVDYTASASDYPLLLRYAVSIQDLDGCLRINPSGAIVSGGSYDDWGNRLGWTSLYKSDCTVDTLGGDANNNISALQSIYKNNISTSTTLTPGVGSHSWRQVKSNFDEIINASFGGTYKFRKKALTLMSPFGDSGRTAEGSSSSIGWRVNIHTAPKKVIENMIWAMTDRASIGGITSLVSGDGTGMAGDAITTAKTITGAAWPTATKPFTDYETDIAYALTKAIIAARAAHETGAGASVQALQNRFLKELSVWDINKCFSDNWTKGIDVAVAGVTLTEWSAPKSDYDKSSRCEKAVNDVLQTFFAKEDSIYDDGVTGVYSFDWDGSGSLENFSVNASTVGCKIDTAVTTMEESDYSDLYPDTMFDGISAVAPPSVARLSPEAMKSLGGSSSKGYSSTSIYKAGGATETIDGFRTWTGGFYIGKSRFFRVVVRGQLRNTETTHTTSEANMEFVLAVDPDGDGNVNDSHILFQRWIMDK